MSEVNIDINGLVEALNNQVASLNLENHIARLHIKALQAKLDELSDGFTTPSQTTKSKN